MPTAVWFGCCNLYLILAFLSSRYWYPVNVLFFVFLASCIKDWTDISNLSKVTLKAKVLIIACIATIFAFSSIGLKFLKKELKHHAELNAHYEDMAHFMNQNIPSGQTIYHAAWSDSPFFICLNPKNNYLVVLDPIYMFHRYPKESEIYRLLRKGEILKPHEVLSKVFGVNYGYTRKDNKLYDQIKKDPDNFKIIYENNLGVVFEIIRSS